MSTCVDRATRHSADGRWPADNTAHLRDVGVHQLRAATAASTAVPVAAADSAPLLDARELTILSSWAEALAEAGTADEVDAVLTDASTGATWRANVGLEPPSATLGAALAALADVAQPANDGALTGDPLGRLVRRVVRSAREARPQGADPAPH